MNLYENFKPRCSIDEANRIGWRYTTCDIGPIAEECYCNAFNKCTIQDNLFKQNTALISVYMLGFLSGSRAVRERKHKTTHEIKKG